MFPRQDLPGDKLAAVRTRITALYAAHALEIADSLGDKPLCVVTGPRRFGKTLTLLPTLAGILQGRGHSVHIVNGRDYEEVPFTVDTLPPGHFDVIIIDEANVLTRSQQRTVELLYILHQKGNAIVSVITFNSGYESGALHDAKILQDAEYSISKQVANIVRLPQMIVTPQVARDLLTLYSPINDGTVRAQVVTYIVARAPLNPHVLLELSAARSISEVNRIVLQRKRTLFQHALTPDEYGKLEQSLQE